MGQNKGVLCTGGSRVSRTSACPVLSLLVHHRSNRPPEQQFTHAVSPNSSTKAADPEPEENEHAIKITNKSFSSGGGGAGHRVGSNIRGPPSRPPVSSAPIAVAAGDSSFKEKYAGQKSISSEQLEHATDEGPDERYSQFSGNTSLGSDQFYGNDEEATQSGSAGDMARKVSLDVSYRAAV